MKRNFFTLSVGLLLVVIFGLPLFVFQVRQSEVAMVTTFGKPTRPITEPGRHYKWPWPIQKVYKFDQRIQNFEDRLVEGLTKDSFTLLTSAYVGWQITDPVAFFPKFAGSLNSIAEAESKIQDRLENVERSIVGNHPLSDFVSTSQKGAGLLAIEQEMSSTIQQQISTNNWGLEIRFLGIKKLQLPESVSKTVFDRMQAERKVLSDTSQSEGESEAKKIHSQADTTTAVMLSDAESKATQIRALGEAQAAESLAVFKQNPELAKFIFQLDALKESLKDHSTLIFDANTPPFGLLNGVSTNLLRK
ncbi:MAG: protease modulator HflC [Limisphaerales bacterium]